MYKKNSPLPVISLCCAVIALILSVIALLPGRSGPDQSQENPALEQQVQELQSQVAALTARLEQSETIPSLADWNLAAAAWADGAGADVTLTAMPGGDTEGLELIFRVELEGQEVASETCTLEEGRFTATVSLPAADGYGYYCELVRPDGNSSSLPLTTPENPTDEHLIHLQSSLNAYCILTISEWTSANNQLLITDGYVEVHLPLIGTSGDTTVKKAELVLRQGDSEVARASVDTLSAPTNGHTATALSDVRFTIPELGKDGFLELVLEVTLSDGQTITAPGAGWFAGDDGLSIVVG